MTNGSRHISENMEISIPESMVQKRFRSLKRSGRAPNNMNYRDIFAVSTCDAVDSGKLSNPWKQLLPCTRVRLTKCCDKGTQPFHSSITISRICSIQFIAFNQRQIDRCHIQLPIQVNPSTSSIKSI